MIRSYFGLTQNPFDARELQLLPQQQEIHDTLKVHCQQGGLCLVVLYLALIAFSGGCCRIVIRLPDVCYTGNLANRTASR